MTKSELQDCLRFVWADLNALAELINSGETVDHMEAPVSYREWLKNLRSQMEERNDE